MAWALPWDRTAPPLDRASREDRGDLVALLALVALVVVAFSPSFAGDWLWDDDVNVTASNVVQRVAGIVDIWTHPTSTQQFYPLTHTTFWLQWRLFGSRPFFFHALNVLLHAGAVVALWRTLRLVMDRGAWLAAALFAVHPVQVESVAWITERKNVLAGLFAALAMYAHVRSIGDEPRRERRARVLAAACFVLALAAKSAVATLPIAMVLVGELRRRRLPREACTPRALAQSAWKLAPLFAIGLASGLATAYLERTRVGAGGPEFAWPWVRRLLVACHALWFYPSKLLAPFPLSFEYPLWDVSPSHVTPWLSVGAVVLAAALLALGRKRVPFGLQAAVGSYVALIFPALSFFNVYFMRYAFAQDHFQYFACAPLLAVVAWLTVRALGSRPAMLGAAGVLLVGGSTALAVRRSFVFRSNATLFADAIRVDPSGRLAYTTLAAEAQRRGDKRAVVSYLEHVARTRPGDAAVQNSLGVALMEVGRPRDAVEPFRRAIDAVPEDDPGSRAVFSVNLGAALEATGSCVDARTAYEAAHVAAPTLRTVSLRLAWQLARCPPTDAARAVQLATEACDVPEPTCLGVVAAAHAADNDLPSAIDAVTRAEVMARAMGDSAAAAGYGKQLASYRRAEGAVR